MWGEASFVLLRLQEVERSSGRQDKEEGKGKTGGGGRRLAFGMDQGSDGCPTACCQHAAHIYWCLPALVDGGLCFFQFTCAFAILCLLRGRGWQVVSPVSWNVCSGRLLCFFWVLRHSLVGTATHVKTCMSGLFIKGI